MSRINRAAITMHPLSEYLAEYKELNVGNKYRPVAVGRYGIRTRESIYSKELAKDYSKNKLIHKGTLTVGMGSVQMDIGILSEDATYSVSPVYHTYRISGVDYDYLRYCLQCRNLDMFTRYMKRGSRQGKSIDLSRWIEYEIPVYPNYMQLEIVERLNRVQTIIELRQHELTALDDLIKARFVEMFGDYHTNSKGFETHKGNELFRFSSGKFLPEEKRLESGVPVYGGNGIAWYTNTPLIDYPTIIIGRVGAQCGNIHTVTEPVWITDNAIYIKEKKTEKFTLEFLAEMMKIMDFYQYADFSGQPKITQKPLETVAYLTPPIEMQKAFTGFVAQVDKSKVVVQKALNEALLLFDSLMQKYFG